MSKQIQSDNRMLVRAQSHVTGIKLIKSTTRLECDVFIRERNSSNRLRFIADRSDG